MAVDFQSFKDLMQAFQYSEVDADFVNAKIQEYRDMFIRQIERGDGPTFTSEVADALMSLGHKDLVEALINAEGPDDIDWVFGNIYAQVVRWSIGFSNTEDEIETFKWIVDILDKKYGIDTVYEHSGSEWTILAREVNQKNPKRVKYLMDNYDCDINKMLKYTLEGNCLTPVSIAIGKGYNAIGNTLLKNAKVVKFKNVITYNGSDFLGSLVDAVMSQSGKTAAKAWSLIDTTEGLEVKDGKIQHMLVVSPRFYTLDKSVELLKNTDLSSCTDGKLYINLSRSSTKMTHILDIIKQQGLKWNNDKDTFGGLERNGFSPHVENVRWLMDEIGYVLSEDEWANIKKKSIDNWRILKFPPEYAEVKSLFDI